ncbi:MAG: FAD/NAD(P)-binding protein [Bacteroidota bacterium]
MLDWLTIGGGVHGTFLSHVLTGRLGWSRDHVRVLDPHDQPLARWHQMTANVGMTFMRSSIVHHLALDPFSLKQFAKTPEGAPLARFTYPYKRPAYRLFQEHTAHVVQAHRLDTLRVQGRALGLHRTRRGWRVETETGALEARRVLLALGQSEQPCWPAWAQALRTAGGPVHHLFEAGFRRKALPAWQHAVVVGGGISAAQVALALAERQPGTVTLLARHPHRVHQLDADPGWMGPKRLRDFHQLRSTHQRRLTINAARHRGSVPPDVLRRLRRAHQQGRLTHHLAEISQASAHSDGSVDLHLRASPDTLQTDCLVLATGFETQRPGGAWLTAAVHEHELRCGVCGHPIVDPTLRWAEGLYVTGPLAELEIGPVARNIVGARLASARLPHAA